MEEDLRARLNALLTKQTEMQKQLQQLGEEYQEIDKALKKISAQKASQQADTPPASHEKVTDAINATSPKKRPSSPPPVPSHLLTNKVSPSVDKASSAESTLPKAEIKSEPIAPPPEKKQPGPTSHSNGEWEINFGRIWFVRIGILLLLTGLIFLSTYAYKNWLFNAGPAVKVTFFMAISLTLTGIGMWLDRWKERFRQYGRVVAAGGLAIGYYTIYAAHFVPSLKLVSSPVLTGLLLTLWAGVMLAYSVWKKSRVVAVMAIGLAYYGTIVNPSGWLSLFSALLLSCAGLWLMFKFRWIAIGLGTVTGAYIAHAFWLGFYPQETASSVRFTYLASYWILFTAALAMPVARAMKPSIQRTFCVINNGACWCLTTFMIPAMTAHPEIGWISIGIGTSWIIMAYMARSGKLWSPSLAPIFGYQGILIASLGILLEATGYTRFLVMAVEACILLAGAKYFGGTLTRLLSLLALGAALVTALPDLNGGYPAPWPSYAALSLACAIYTALLRWDRASSSSMAAGVSADFAPVLSGMMTWIVTGAGVFYQWESQATGIIGLMLTATTVMLTYVLIPSLRWKQWTTDIALVSVIASLIGAWWYLSYFESISPMESILPIVSLAVFWLLSPQLSKAWAQQLGDTDQSSNRALEWLMSLAFWVITIVTMWHHIEPTSVWLYVGGLTAILGHATAEYLRRHSIGIPALTLHGVAIIALVIDGRGESIAGWIPAFLLLLHLALSDKIWQRFDRPAMRSTLGFVLFVATALQAFMEFDRPDLTLTALGSIMLIWAYQRKDHRFAVVAGALPILTACLAALAMHSSQDWFRYIPIITALLIHGLLWCGTHINPSWNENWKPVRVILITTGVLHLFIAATVHVQASFDGAGVAICWSLLASALFCAGLAIRCRPYRLLGLWWLAAAVLHVVFIDVMKLDTLGRILSFISLGLVLLALGFLYNKFQENIRKFL